MITNERIEEIKAAEAAATDGPWGYDYDESDPESGDTLFQDMDRPGELIFVNMHDEICFVSAADGVFIAMARTAIPELLSEQEERDELELENAALKMLIAESVTGAEIMERERVALRDAVQHYESIVLPEEMQASHIAIRADSLEEENGAIRAEVDALISEVNCRLEHGANDNFGHLEYVHKKLHDIIDDGTRP